MDVVNGGKRVARLAGVGGPRRALQEFSRIRLLRAAAGKGGATPSGITAVNIESKSRRSRCREDYSVESSQIDERFVAREIESEGGVAEVD